MHALLATQKQSIFIIQIKDREEKRTYKYYVPMYHPKLTTYEFKRVLGTMVKRKENKKGRTSKTLGNIFFKDLNHTIILCCNIISCREREKKAEC